MTLRAAAAETRGRRWVSLAAVVRLPGVLAACGGSSKPPPRRRRRRPRRALGKPAGRRMLDRCARSDLPRACGARRSRAASVSAVEAHHRAQVRRHLLLRFHRLRATFRRAEERQVVDNGQTLHINLESRQFAKPGRPEVRWSAVAAGDFDATLKSAAKGLAALDKPFFITFDHEADNKAKIAARGTPGPVRRRVAARARGLSPSRRHPGDLDLGRDGLSAQLPDGR